MRIPAEFILLLLLILIPVIKLLWMDSHHVKVSKPPTPRNDPRFCEYCNRYNPDHDFCPGCGAPSVRIKMGGIPIPPPGPPEILHRINCIDSKLIYQIRK